MTTTEQYQADRKRVTSLMSAVKSMSPKLHRSFEVGYYHLIDDLTDGKPTAVACVTVMNLIKILENLNVGFITELGSHLGEIE